MAKHYFQFPLCALSLPDQNEISRLDHIISFCCVEAGKKRWSKLAESQKDALRSDLGSIDCHKTKGDPLDDGHLQAMLGATHLNVRICEFPSTITRHARLFQYLAEFEGNYGPDVRVRLAANLVFEARDKKGLSFEEIAVLAAIYSKIGANKRPVRITRDEVLYRAHGYKSRRVFLVTIGLCPPPIKKRRIRTLIELLHARRFFARLTFARRETYYSHRMSAERLADAIFQLKTKRALSQHSRIMANQQLTRQIQEERRKLATPPLDSGHWPAT